MAVWVCPEGVTTIDLTLHGAAGGGGGGEYLSEFGNPGAYIATGGTRGTDGDTTVVNGISVVPGTSYTYTLGSGGIGGAGGSVASPDGTDGVNGGASTAFGYTAAGGAKGVHGKFNDVTAGTGGIGGRCWKSGTGEGAGESGTQGEVGSITIYYSLPNSAFTGTPLAGSATLSVQFTGGTGATTRSWSFGDSGSDVAIDPSHNYTTPGVYTVSLTCWNSYGYTTTTKTGYVIVYRKPHNVATFIISDFRRG